MTEKKGMEIKVYGKESCGVCKEAKANISNAIETNKLIGLVKLVYKDIEKDAIALAEYASFGTDKVPYLIFKDLDSGTSTKASAIAPSVGYLTEYFKGREYIK